MVVEEIPILKDIIADNQELIDDMTDKLNALKPIIIEITEGKGRFNMDPHIHCANTVADMKELANKALEILEGSDFTTNHDKEEKND